MLARRQGWQDKLEAFIRSRADSTFRWGETDCCCFVLDATRIILDRFPKCLEGIAGYNDEITASIVARKLGGSDRLIDAIHMIMSKLHAKRIDISDVTDGDICLIEHPRIAVPRYFSRDRVAMGVVCNGMVYTQGVRGLKTFSPLYIIEAWRL
jgi:hypothetical protein